MEITKEILYSIVELLGSKELKKDVETTISGLESEDANIFESIKGDLVTFNNNRDKEVLGKGYRQDGTCSKHHSIALLVQIDQQFSLKLVVIKHSHRKHQ